MWTPQYSGHYCESQLDKDVYKTTLKCGHLTNWDTFGCINTVHNRGVQL